ncbi:MAG: Ldh family oxidoreductase [Gammaproteobacteria bacterium]
MKAEKLINVSKQLLIASGCDTAEAQTLSQILVWCDQVGRHNQGVWRLPLLTRRFAKGLIKSPCNPEIKQTSSSVCNMNADEGSGHYIAYLAMEKAIEIAHKTGVGIVGVNNSNFFGAGAYYINQACESGMISIGMSNSFPKVAAYGGVKSVLGTNPFAFGAPRQKGNHFLLDMATSSSAGSSITKSSEQGAMLKEGIAIDSKGDPITDPDQVASGSLLPFGGAKGFGLSLMVEILSGVITGAGFSHGVKSMYKNFDESGDNGHFFIAIDIEKLIPIENYYSRIEALITSVKASAEGFNDKEVILPGEMRWEQYETSLDQGISLDRETTDSLNQLSKQLEVELNW